MAAIPNDITIFKGDTHVYTLTAFEESTRLDLTDWTIRFTVKQNKTDADNAALIQVLGVATVPVSGLATITLTKNNTDSLSDGTYYYDIQLDNTNTGDVKTVRNGLFIVLQDITRTSLA